MIPFVRPLKLAFTVCLCLPVFGQSETVNLHFLSFPKVANPQPAELLIGENETIEIELPTNSVTTAYEVPGMTNWALGKSSGSEPDDFSFQKYGSTPSINSKEQLVLVTRQGSSNADGFKLVALDYSNSSFSGGEYFFMNATTVDVAGIIGELKFALKPGNHTFVMPKPTKTRDGRDYSYAKFYFRNEQEVQPFFSATWRLIDRARTMVFFYHDPGTKQIRLHILRSFITQN